MPTLNDLQKQQIIQREASVSAEKILEYIQRFDNLSLEDFPAMDSAKRAYIQEKINSVPNPAEQQEWKAIEPHLAMATQDLLDALNQYIRNWESTRPTGNHVDEAWQHVQRVEAQLDTMQRQMEENDWNNVDLFDIASLLGYLQKYPRTAHKEDIDNSVWALVNREDVQEIQNYISAFPVGFHVNEARFLLNCRCEEGERRKREEREKLGEAERIICRPNAAPRPLILSNDDSFFSTDKISDKSITVDNKVKSFFPKIEKNKRTFRDILFRNKYKDVYSSIFAPAEVKRKSHMLVQVYLHLYEESEKVKLLAQESDKNAERRDYIPLSLKLKKGDKVDVEFNVYGETRLMSERKLIEWRGSFVKSSFDYFVPKDIDVDELSCVVLLSVNGVPLGEMRFITQIVDVPRRLNPEIFVNKYKKVFISYSHQDESKVKFLHEGLELGSVPHFFDRAYLKTGDVFPQKIQDYIESADLFILCWSQNASESHYVQKERMLAIERAFPKVQPESRAKLRIYPLSIEPRADLPSDMKGIYNFGEI